MLVWLLLLLSVIVSWVMIPSALGKKKKKLIFLGLVFAIMVFVLGSRSEYNAVDLYGYHRWYQRAMDLPLGQLLEYTGVEAGYLILNNTLSEIVPWEYFIFYFQAAFCTGIMFWYIYKNVDNVFMGVMVYICMGPWQFFLTGFRQSMAICLCLIALEQVKKHKVTNDFLALGLIALAASLHTTAWLFLIIFVIKYFKVGRNVVVFSGIITVTLSFFVDDLVTFVNDSKGRVYESGEFSGNALGGIIPILIYLCALILCYIVWYGDKDFTNDYSMEIKLLVLGFCLYTIRYNTLVFERISFYFTPAIAVVLPSAIDRQKNDKERLVVSAVCIALCIGLYIYRTVQQFGEFEFYWDNYLFGDLWI